MRLLLLSEADSIHTYRWATSLQERGHTVGIFSLRVAKRYDYQKHGIQLYTAASNVNPASGIREKLQYLSAIRRIRRAIKDFVPDILHAHYATSYGLLGALCRFHPYVVSLWGSDVYDFPKRYPGAKSLLKFVFRRADRLLSTSHVMARQASQYTSKPLGVTPFGVDLKRFSKSQDHQPDPNLIGCVKLLRPTYGIDVLIRAFARLVERNPSRPLRLEIVGDGDARPALEQLTHALGLHSRVEFTGYRPNTELAKRYSRYLVAVFPSNSESFGVVAVEAMACQCPVIASDLDGFRETVADTITGFLAPRGDVEALARAIQRFIDSPTLRDELGQNARKRVIELYNWEDNVVRMESEYERVRVAFRAK